MNKKRSCCCGVLPARWWWLLTLLGLPLLFLLMLGSRQGVVENDLASRSGAGLKDAGMGWVKVNLAGHGRDLLLQGTAPSAGERDKAVQLAQGIYGVREVQNFVDVAVPQADAMTDSGMQTAAAVAPEAPKAPVSPTAPAAPEPPTVAVKPEAPAAPISPEPPTAPVKPEAPVAPSQTMPDSAQNQQAASAGQTPAAKEQAAQDCQKQLNDVMTGKTILFATDKAAIKPDSIALLDSLVGIVSTCNQVVSERGIQISGHTDNVGNDVYNQNLSQRRADAVKAYFVKKGVDGGLIKSVGYGESKPVASNDTAEGRSQNRRITFEISPE